MTPWHFTGADKPVRKTWSLLRSCVTSEGSGNISPARPQANTQQLLAARAARELVVWHRQLCVMNCAQGSPPSAAERQSPEDEATGGVGHDNLNLPSLRRCKSKGSDLPFSVESLISDSRSSPEPDSGRVRAEETECASPNGAHRSKSEAADLSEDTSAWFQGSYASSISENRRL